MSAADELVHEAAQRALRATDTDVLLTKAYHLTHKMQGLRRGGGSNTHAIADAQAQRDLITAEIVRRVDETQLQLEEAQANLEEIVNR